MRWGTQSLCDDRHSTDLNMYPGRFGAVVYIWPAPILSMVTLMSADTQAAFKAREATRLRNRKKQYLSLSNSACELI